MPHQRDWIDYLVAFAPLIAIAVAMGVALMQYYLQRRQSNQNLYDKRFGVYWAVREFTKEVYRADDWHSDESLDRFALDTAHAPYLFGSDVKTFFHEVATLTYKIKTLREDQKRYIETHEGPFITNSQIAAVHWQLMHYMRLNHIDVFAPYLQLHQDQSWLARLASRIDRWVDQEMPGELKGRYEK